MENPEKYIEKFWRGETSLEEEQMLQKWFQQEDIPAQYLQTKEYFAYLVGERKKEMPNKTMNNVRPIRRINWGYIRGIAASLLIFIGIYVGVEKFSLPEKGSQELAMNVDTYEDPEEAYEEVRKALLMVSVKMKTGKKHKKQIRKIGKIKNYLPQE